MSGLGYLGQRLYERLDAQNSKQLDSEPRENIWVRMAKSKWSPMKVLSDEDYGAMLQDKVLKLDVEIALINERIEKIKKDSSITGKDKEEEVKDGPA